MKQLRPLDSFPVFSALDESVCSGLLKDGKVRQIRMKPEELIEGGNVFCIQAGTAAVYAKNDAHPALIRYLNEGDLFGAASVYTENARISRVQAQTAVTLLEISRETIDQLLARYPEFARSYVCFLSDRIAFLNGRIACVTAGSSEQKLAGWLLAIAGEKEEFAIPVSMSSLAKLLDLGRASLYRAFDVLEEKKLIERDGNTVRIMDRADLKALV